MEVKELLDALDPKLKEYKEQVAAEAKKSAEEFDSRVKQINEDLAKKGATLSEIAETVTELKAKSNRIGGVSAEAAMDFKSAIAKGLKDNFETIQKVSKTNPIQFKTVGDMALSANLTGDGVATYSLTPSLKGRRKVHFRDISGVQSIPTATGIWKYYINPVGAQGEGSFGNQSEGSSYAQIDYDFQEVTETLDTVAGFARISRQMLRDLPFMQSFLPGELQEDYLRAEDNKFINKLMAYTGAYSFSASVLAEKFIEGIGAIMSRDYEPTSIVTTAANWTTLMNTKPSDYSLPGGGSLTIGAGGDVMVAGVPVQVHNGMTGSHFFIGDFSKVKILQGEGLTVEFFNQDANNVTTGKITVRALADVQLAVLRTDWGIYG